VDSRRKVCFYIFHIFSNFLRCTPYVLVRFLPQLCTQCDLCRCGCKNQARSACVEIVDPTPWATVGDCARAGRPCKLLRNLTAHSCVISLLKMDCTCAFIGFDTTASNIENCTHRYTHMHTRTRSHTHTHTHIHTHAHTGGAWFPRSPLTGRGGAC
jgi:hypothetical protein